jgi:redox-sensitive bicupin YhaK (pirin superfamily)
VPEWDLRAADGALAAVHMDQMGEADYAPGEPKGHPHQGFETVTYMIDGVFRYQDSHGGG